MLLALSYWLLFSLFSRLGSSSEAYATSSKDLHDSVQQIDVDLIVLGNNITLSLADWGNAQNTPANIVHIVRGRTLTLISGTHMKITHPCNGLFFCISKVTTTQSSAVGKQ